MISIPAHLLGEIWEHGENAYPEEGAGVLLGRVEGDSRYVTRVLSFANQFETELRHRRYLITPKDMIAAEDMADSLGLLIIGIFHSHPDHPAKPSDYDREMALPWYSYIITSVYKKRTLESRSWRYSQENAFLEENLFVDQEMKLEEK
jgi:proteasome lid subunit RPN8/RPN11